MKLGRNFIVYLVSSGVAGVMPLALMPFLTHRLAPVDYGVMVTITTLVALVGPLVNWATTAFVGVRYFNVPASEFPSTLSSVLLVPVVNAAILLVLFIIARGALSTWLEIPAGWVAVVPVMALLLFLPSMGQTILSMRDRAIGFAAIEISGALVNFVGTIVLVLWLGWGWEGRIVAAVIASGALSLITLGWFLRVGFLTSRFARGEVKDAVRFGAGGVMHELASYALRLSDRLLIATLVGQAAVGVYAVAVQWTTIMMTVLIAFNRAWVPFLFKSLADDTPASRVRIVRYTYLVWVGLLAFWAVFALATPLGYDLLIDQRYHGSQSAAFWLSVGWLCHGLYLTFVDYLFYLKKTHILAGITVFSLALNVGTSYWLIGVIGANGAAVAFAITSFIVMGIVFAISQRLYPMPWLRSLSSLRVAERP